MYRVHCVVYCCTAALQKSALYILCARTFHGDPINVIAFVFGISFESFFTPNPNYPFHEPVIFKTIRVSTFLLQILNDLEIVFFFQFVFDIYENVDSFRSSYTTLDRDTHTHGHLVHTSSANGRY